MDSNVLCANDDQAERALHDLTDVLVAHPDQGNVWFSLMSLSEIVAPDRVKTRIDLLERFRNLYQRFGDRVRFLRSLNDNVLAECRSTGIPSAPAQVVEEDVLKAIEAGDLVGLLQEAREDWRSNKERLRERHGALALEYRKDYDESPEFRKDFAQIVPTFFSAEALNQCDDIAADLIAETEPAVSLEAVKSQHLLFPCTWTFALLARLAQYAQTISPGERRAQFPSLDAVLTPHANDFIDAEIAGTGGRCGMMITNDRGLIAKLNRLHDANLVRLQGFTVSDALAAYNPPNGRTRS